MRFGVNYTPAVGWFHSWLDFDAAAVAKDMEQIASLGVDHVRIFPLWPVVQPNRTLIRPSALADVVSVVDLAGSFGLDVNVDALQGHLSSFDFVPSWLESWHRRNMFTDAAVVESTASYVRALAAAVADRPNLLGITIGNEVNQFAHAPHPTPHAVTAAQASDWLATMVAAARDGLSSGVGLEARGASVADAPARPWVTVAQYDAAWYDDAQPFGPAHAAEHGDMTVTHSWVFNGAARVHGPLGAGSVRHGEYLMQLAAAWAPIPGPGESARPNWLQEVGAPTNVVPVSSAADFLEGTVRHAAAVQDVFGITWWCSHDVSRSLADFPELEYDLGLFTNDGVLKPTGERFAALVRELGAAQPVVGATADALVLDDVGADGSPNPAFRADCAPGGRFALAWVALAEALGRGPRVVLRSRMGDPGLQSTERVLHRVPADGESIHMSVAHPATMS